MLKCAVRDATLRDIDASTIRQRFVVKTRQSVQARHREMREPLERTSLPGREARRPAELSGLRLLIYRSRRAESLNCGFTKQRLISPDLDAAEIARVKMISQDPRCRNDGGIDREDVEVKRHRVLMGTVEVASKHCRACTGVIKWYIAIFR